MEPPRARSKQWQCTRSTSILDRPLVNCETELRECQEAFSNVIDTGYYYIIHTYKVPLRDVPREWRKNELKNIQHAICIIRLLYHVKL